VTISHVTKNKVRILVRSGAIANSRGLRHTIRLATFVLSILLVTVPGFAARRPSASYHIWSDPAAKEYSHDGLPCSTAPVPGAPGSKSTGPLQQLDQIERQTVNAIRSVPERGSSKSASSYRSAVSRSSSRQPAINFAYHAPVSDGGREDRRPARGR
jgi:hypothetical protein